MINLENFQSRTAADRIDTSEMVIFAIHCTADQWQWTEHIHAIGLPVAWICSAHARLASFITSISCLYLY